MTINIEVSARLGTWELTITQPVDRVSLCARAPSSSEQLRAALSTSRAHVVSPVTRRLFVVARLLVLTPHLMKEAFSGCV